MPVLSFLLVALLSLGWSLPAPQGSAMRTGVSPMAQGQAFRGLWSGKFPPPMPDSLSFVFDFDAAGTWSVWTYNRPNQSFTFQCGPYVVTPDGRLQAFTSTGLAAFSAFPGDRGNRLDIVIVNTMGPGIPSTVYRNGRRQTELP